MSSSAGRRSSASARSSTASQKGSLDDLDMAVVVQTMVDAEKSGVLFTVDPSRGGAIGCSSRRCYGLGEQVVSGEVTPDHYIADRAGRGEAERLVHGGVLTRAGAPQRWSRLGTCARGAVRHAPGHRVGDRGRDAVPAPVAAGDDAVIDRARTLDRAVLERRAPSSDGGLAARARAGRVRGAAARGAHARHGAPLPRRPGTGPRRCRPRPTRRTGERTPSARRGSSASGCAARAPSRRRSRRCERLIQLARGRRRPRRGRPPGGRLAVVPRGQRRPRPTPGHGEATAPGAGPRAARVDVRAHHGAGGARARRAALRGGAPCDGG